jgi:hypothetical protein
MTSYLDQIMFAMAKDECDFWLDCKAALATQEQPTDPAVAAEVRAAMVEVEAAIERNVGQIQSLGSLPAFSREAALLMERTEERIRSLRFLRPTEPCPRLEAQECCVSIDSYRALVGVEDETLFLLLGSGESPRAVPPSIVADLARFFESRGNFTVEGLRVLQGEVIERCGEREDFREIGVLLADGENFRGSWGEFMHSHPLLTRLEAVDPAVVTMGFARLAALLVSAVDPRR